ncbi:MAG: hypothetical protein KIS67_15770 [Verrucomicrobiae bacterium]|nr:hypothetical protein [Verrucomicrobiae bacterium]
MRTLFHRLAHRRSKPGIGRKTIALATLALAACVSTTLAQTLLFQDDLSDPGLSGWVQLGVPGVFSNSNQQALISANCGPLQTNNPFATHFAWGHAIPMPPELTNNWTLEGCIDLVRANQNDAWASVHFLWSPLGNSGYAFLVDEDEAALLKFWNGTGSVAWFFHEPREIKNQNVTLVLSVTRRDANLVINTRVLDKDNANAVVFDSTVIDTPEADPTLPSRSVKGTPSVNDRVGEPWRMVSGTGQIEVTLDWTDPTSGPTGPAQVVYDNVEVWLYESPRPNVVAWGGRSYGSATVPSSLTNAVAVAAGGVTSLALRSDGTVARWGGIFGGWLGEWWTEMAATFPSDLTNVVAIAASTTAISGPSPVACHFLALRADGTVVRWDSSSLPPKTDVPLGLTDVVAVAPGAAHCLALRADGTVVAWGENWAGQTDVPSGLTNAVAVAAGWSHSLALRADGTVVAWGNPDQINVPAGLSNVAAVAAGFAHSLALRADGRIIAWGGSGSWHPEYGGDQRSTQPVECCRGGGWPLPRPGSAC